MTDLTKLNLSQVSKTYGKLAEAARLHRPNTSKHEIFSTIDVIKSAIDTNPEGAKRELDRFREKLEDGLAYNKTDSPSAKDMALIENLHLKMDLLHDKYDSMLRQKEEEVKILKERLGIISAQNRERSELETMQEKIILLKEKIDTVKSAGRFPAEQIAKMNERLEEAKKRLSEYYGQTLNDQMKDLEEEKYLKDTEDASDEYLSDEDSDSDSDDSDDDSSEESDEENNEDNAEDSDSDENQNEMPDISGLGQGYFSDDSGPEDNSQESESLQKDNYSPSDETPTPDWLTETKREGTPLSIDAPNMPSVSQSEKTFAPLPDLNDSEVDFPLDEEERKPNLSDKIKTMFGKRP